MAARNGVAIPGLPQHPQIPPEPTGSEPIVRWGVSFQRAFQRLWTSTVYVINAICKIETLANRPSTPDLDETFFYESDSKALSVGSAGAWVQVGPRRGSATITAGNTSVAVTLTPNEPATTYRILLATNYDNGGIWWTSKAVTGFTVNVKTAAPGGGATVDWLVIRD